MVQRVGVSGGEVSELYNEGVEDFVYGAELEVVFDLMMEKEVLDMKERVEMLIRERVYERDEFPISCGGLRYMQACMMFSFWKRKGKGIRVEMGEIKVCELKESPFWKDYSSQGRAMDEVPYSVGEGKEEEVEEVREKEEGEWV